MFDGGWTQSMRVKTRAWCFPATAVRNQQHVEIFESVDCTATDTHARTRNIALVEAFLLFRVYFGDSQGSSAGSLLGLLGDCQSMWDRLTRRITLQSRVGNLIEKYFRLFYWNSQYILTVVNKSNPILKKSGESSTSGCCWTVTSLSSNLFWPDYNDCSLPDNILHTLDFS